MENLEPRDLVLCTDPHRNHYGQLGVVFQRVESKIVDVDFRWGGGGLYRCINSQFTILEKDWNGKWLAARAAGEPEYPLPLNPLDTGEEKA